MPDEPATGGSTPVTVCPWCSAPLAATDTETCSSCGAKLQPEGEPQVPGLTAIDPVAVIEGARPPQRPRNRLVAWLTGADIDEGTQKPASPDALAPPPPDVRREILRLQMEAELSQLSAEVEAMASDEAIAAQDEGDTARLQQAVAAVLGADATTDAVNEAAEVAAAEQAAAASAVAEAAGDTEATGDAAAPATASPTAEDDTPRA